jgi:hypothetical protein
LVFALLISVASQGATFHVEVGGSDATGDGTASAPWGTIPHALGEVPDESVILVGPGTYTGRVRLDREFTQGVIIRAEPAYEARLRHDATVVTCYYGRGIALEGFDIAHSGPGAGALVVQIQDLIGDPGGEQAVSRITLRNNILHDSYNNDLLKVNNACREILIEGNLFFNQMGSDEHIDINSVVDVTVRGNVFFNDFEGSGRTNTNSTSSFIVVKDSDGDYNDVVGSERVSIEGNVFLGWQGSTGSNFILFGEDGQNFFEAVDCLVQNNLLLGNSLEVMRASFGVKGCKDILFRHNTVVGDLPSLAYTMRLNTEGSNPPNENIRFYNNVWSDPTGTFGAENSGANNDFSDTPPGETSSFVLDNNLYWNGGSALPQNPSELVNYTDDTARVIEDPELPSLAGIVLPRWMPESGSFADGSMTVREVLVNLVRDYGTPASESPLRNRARSDQSPVTDILGNSRGTGAAPDIGAVELVESTGESSVSGWRLY